LEQISAISSAMRLYAHQPEDIRKNEAGN